MKDLKQIRISGFGGQGIILAGAILGHAAARDGKWVAGSSSYGAQARGGYARSDIVISNQPIVFPHVIKSDILIAMSQAAYDKYIEDMTPGSIIFFDKQQVSRQGFNGVRQVGIPSTSCAINQTGRKQVANMVMLGAAVSATGVVSKESLLWAIGENVDKRYLDLNQKSIETGFALGEERWRFLEERTGR
ncbi:MAG TPA: 2-oxoacid:acceptor oxidoreductase family protein [Desulfatiglandales bacterium]|nr:2-oxoacid:acceptor oxidoreductase family protein [Desulfatiglandales bacterium]